MNGAFDISVVIPTRDRWPVLAGTLAALDSQDLAGVRAEVVVVDNGSRDPAPDLGVAHPYDLVTVREAVPGAAAARNAGIAAARSDLVLFLGDDCRPAVPGLVRGHVDAHAGGDRLLAIVGGIEWDPAVGVTPLMRWLTETGKLIDMGRLERGEEPGWQAFYTGNLSLRRGALLDVAGFDERFRGYGWEDADLGLRLADAGVRLEHRASLGVLHHHAYGLSDSLRRMEAMGRGANLLERLHDHRRPLPGPAKGRGRAALARAAAPLALRGVLGRRASHLSAYARGHAAAPIDDDPGLRGYGRFAPPGGPRPPVSVVVPFLGSAAEGEELACALEALERRPGDELIVVDNSPAPAFPGAAVRATAQRSSYFARNAGADRARGEWLLFLDADCRPRATLIDDYFAERIGERCGAVAGRVMAAPGQDALVARYARSRGHLSQAAHMRDDHLPYGITANLLVRRAAFDALGGFHEGLRSGGDADLSWRLQDEGWAIDYREPAAVWHLHRERVWPLVRQAARYSAAIAWMERHRPGSSARPRVARRLARAGAGAVAWLLLGRFERAAFKLLDGVVVVAEGAGYLFSNAAPQAADDARGGPAVIADAFPDAGRPARVPPGARLVEAARRPARLDRASASGLLVRYAEDDGIARRAGQTALLAALHPVRALGAWRSHHHHRGSGTGVYSKGTHRPRLAALAPAARRLAAAGPDWLAAAPGAERRARALARLTGTALAPEAPPLTASAGSGSSRSSRPASRSSPR